MDLASISIKDKIELLKALEELEVYKLYNKLDFCFPDETRSGYVKHLEFFENGTKYRQRALIAANRVGKSYAGCYELTLHLTGLYPDWWNGRRFEHPIDAWVVGSTSDVVRDTTQAELLGPTKVKLGTGMIPMSCIIPNSAVYTAHRADTISVKHVSGGNSTLGFKSDSAGIESFMGTSRHVILCDEEISLPVYLECLMRTTTVDGMIMCTFTPLKGLTELILSFLQGGDPQTPMPGIGITTIDWDQAPHLSEATKKEMLAALPPHQRLARSQGVPQIGSGAVFQIDPGDYVVQPFEIPSHWERVAGLDVGWKTTACVWGAIDPNDNKLYIYSEYYAGEKEPSIHATNIRTRGESIPINIDTAARGRSQADGSNLFDMYRNLGLNVINAIKCVETGIYTCYEGMIGDRIKVFSNCSNMLSELKTYRRDDKGSIVKKNDHAMDAFRYLIMGKDKSKPLTPKVVDQAQYTNVSYQYRKQF